MSSTGKGTAIEDWAAHSAIPPRSVFGNYSAQERTTEAALPEREVSRVQTRQPLQEVIDLALARSMVYRFLAQTYEDPTPESWKRVMDCRQNFEAAVRILAADSHALAAAAGAFEATLKEDAFDAFLTCYLAAFGHAARGQCPPNEIEYGDLKADPLFQPHRLADLAAFYRAFGMEVAEDADERHDHICLELEFMCVLAAKEAYALEHQLDWEDLSVCRAGQRKFLREHLGRWSPAFARRLARMAGDSALGALAKLTRAFIEAECARQGVTPGSEDLLLRPVDGAAENLCASCGVTQLPPGALPQQ